MFEQFLIILLAIPIVALVGVIAGGPARSISFIAALGNFALAFVYAVYWNISRDPSLGEFSLVILAKPEISLALGVPDAMSLIMILLTTLVTIAAILSGKCPEGRERLWFSSILLISLGALGAFLSIDLFFFYAFHELALIPTFLIIGLLGKGDRKTAAWKITLYLAFGSIILLAGLLWLVVASGAETLLFTDILNANVLNGGIETKDQIGIAALLIVGFGVLVSLFPFHSWAAPAYSSAPAPIAMLHAGVLKKFGLYGLLKLMPAVPAGMQYWLVALIVLLLGNIIWVGMITINQKRLDNMLANSSVMHMGYVFLAIAALAAAGGSSAVNSIALPAAVILMFGHGVSIALLFSLSDLVHQKTGSLRMEELGGLAKSAPKLAFLFGLAGMASIGLPGLANFAGEAAVFLSGFKNWTAGEPLGAVQIGTIIAIFGVVLSAIYMLRAIRFIFHGETVKKTESATDLSREEHVSAIILAVTLLVVGICPNLLFNLFNEPTATGAPVTTVLNEAP